jgi:hypothetical protein
MARAAHPHYFPQAYKQTTPKNLRRQDCKLKQHPHQQLSSQTAPPQSLHQSIMAEEAEVRAAPQAAEPEINDKPSVDNPDEEMERHDEDMQQEDGNEEMEQEDDDTGSNSDSSSNQNKEDTADVQSNENKEGEHLSDYELARLERIKRNQARLASLGLTPGMNIPQVKRKKQQKKKKSMDLVPTRELPSRAGRAIFMESAKQEMRQKYREKEKEEESKNLDACYACQLEGGGESFPIVFVWLVEMMFGVNQSMLALLFVAATDILYAQNDLYPLHNKSY